METPTALAIGQLTDYLRGLTQRLDPGAGWYGEFLRRDPEGMRACLDGIAVPPWDILESLLLDLPPGAAAPQEEAYAAGLRAAAVAAWDARPGGARELRILLATATGQRKAVEEALSTLTARLGATADPARAEALSRELAWTRDDALRARSRQTDLRSRLAALGPLPAVPRPRDHVPPAPSGRPFAGSAPYAPGADAFRAADPEPARRGRPDARHDAPARGPAGEPGGPAGPVESGEPGGPAGPVQSGGPGGPAGTGGLGDPGRSGAVARGVAHGAFVAELLTLRARGRGGEAHALLCEAVRWPAGELPALADELGYAGLAADWATLLWEAASLPPARLAAAAAALGDAGREADSDRLLRQCVARPAADVAEAALALGGAGRDREARSLLEAYVRLRTAEEAAALARHDPHWFAPRLLQAARVLSAAHHRALAHALRTNGLPTS
ncbi:hypothetical protein WDV06_04230 [Streptomyces racemochromogenes]|uniref:UL36 very large tegument protein n=1 Tax=Streptomyces racemochromogenes TaxID=67353 RepID=A0ABW7P7I2_9ACTN